VFPWHVCEAGNEAYGPPGELIPEVSEAQITLARADLRKDLAAFLSGRTSTRTTCRHTKASAVQKVFEHCASECLNAFFGLALVPFKPTGRVRFSERWRKFGR